MTMRILIAALAMASWVVPCSAAGDKPEIIVEMDRNRIYEGESVLYRVTLNNVENPRRPDLSGFDDFSITPLGEQTLDSTFTTIINGRRSDIIRRGRQYNYRVTPQRAGNLTIPAPTVEVDGQKLVGKEMSLVVTAPQDQDLVRMDITAVPASVYPLQQFTVILSISVKSLPPPYADESPVGIQTNPPDLQIPWVDDEHLPKGLKPNVTWQRWLQSLQSRRGGGFAVNNIGTNSVLSFFEDRRLTFQPEPQDVRLPDKSGTMASYRQYQFKRTFIAKNVDQYVFGPVSLKGIFVSGVNSSGAAETKDIYAIAKPLTVKIKDVPDDGRPPTYIGAIGRFQFDADLSPHKAKTGDPMTLTLTLTGQGSFDRATMPELAKIPQIADNFKIYEATEQNKGDQRTFTCALRPLSAGVKEFPPIEISYFDVQDEKYVTLASKPIPIDIEKADKLAGRDIVASPSGVQPSQKELETRQEGVYANVTDLGQLADESIRPERWLAALGGLAGLYGAGALVVVRVRRLSGDTVRQRRRSAPANARRLLHEAVKELSAGHVREGADRLESAIVNLVADWTNAPAEGMTPAEACRKLQSLDVDDEVLNRARQFMENCESAHYGASPQAAETLRHDAKGVLEAVIRALRKK
jgi:hypothetical protein